MDFSIDIGAIDQRIQYAASFVLRYLVVLASAGAFAMALLELAKTLFEWRTRFHAGEVTYWFLQAQDAARQRVAKAEQHPREAFAQLLVLCSSVGIERARTVVERLESRRSLQGLWLRPQLENAPFAQELEVMTSHFRDAIDIAINTPRTYEALFRFATSGADPDDVKEWLKRAGAAGQVGDVSASTASQRAETFARLHHAARRKLDAFALFTFTRWANRQQLAANVLGVGVLFCATVGTDVNVVEAIVISALGGIFAPVAKDMVVALQQVRQR